MQNYLPACKIVSTHGVRGEMKALPLCDGAAFLAKFKRLFTTADGAGETRVLGVRAQGNVILLRLDGVNDMDAARAQVGRVYYLAKADARRNRPRVRQTDKRGPPRRAGHLYRHRHRWRGAHAARCAGICQKYRHRGAQNSGDAHRGHVHRGRQRRRGLN